VAPDKQASAGDQEATPDGANQLADLGLTVTPSEDGSGLVVTDIDPGSDAADQGIRAGDVIKSVNAAPVASAEDLSKAMESASAAGRKAVLLQVMRDDNSRFVALPIAKG
jgi:serine protease Do